MSARDDYLMALESLVGGDLPLSDGDRILAVSLAVKRYSKDRPRQVVEDVDGDGGFDYDLSDLEAWVDGKRSGMSDTIIEQSFVMRRHSQTISILRLP